MYGCSLRAEVDDGGGISGLTVPAVELRAAGIQLDVVAPVAGSHREIVADVRLCLT
jgi:hypothetical protein